MAALALGFTTSWGFATTAPAVEPEPGTGSTAPLRPFRLDQVRLGEGILQEKRDRMKSFLKEYDEKRFLILFNQQAGRPNPEGLAVPGGWEDGGLLSGHWAGHFMTALSQAYADQGEKIYKDKLEWMVGELAACQKAITDRMNNGENGGNPGNGSETEKVGRVPGRFGNALQLTAEGGGAEYITLPQEAINQVNDFTMATWIRLNQEQAWSRVFDFGHDTTTYMFLTSRSGSGSGAPRFSITTSGSGGEQMIDGDAPLPTGEWVHLAVTMASGSGKLYVNGKLVGTNNAMTLSPRSLDNPGNRWIGRSQYGDPLLNGTIDEFHIFNRALDDGEISSLQASAAGSTGGGNIAWYRFDEENGTLVKDSSPNKRDAGIVGGKDGDDDASWVPTHPGYLGALPEDTVLRLGPPRWAVYGGDLKTNTWAPWYTQHKIMRGLLDTYYNTNNKQALEVVTKMADWAHLALTVGDKNQPDYKGNLTRAELNLMWDLYIAGENGGVNEVFPEIYALTGDERHLETAKFHDNRQSLFGASVADKDILVVRPQDNPGPRRPDRLHANSHVPQFVGYLRIFEHSSQDEEYFSAAKNFYGWVVPDRHFASGGIGGNYPGSNDNTELFQNRGNIANAIGDSGAETCTTYNLIKLGRNLFLHEQNATYMDDYERGLYNMIAGSRADTNTTSDPQVTYFQPLTPGSRRDYGNTGTCCGGTGLESHTKYQETVYFRSADDSTLWVNLYVPSTLDWQERGFTVKQETKFPREGVAKMTISGGGKLKLNLRVPGWIRRGFEVTINGRPFGGEEKKKRKIHGGSYYLTIDRDWKDGDAVEIKMPLSIRVERALDRPDTQALMWGPILLQTLGTPSGGSGSFHELSLYRHLKRDGDYAAAAVNQTGTTAKGDPLFTIADPGVGGGGAGLLTARPYYISDGEAVSSYFRRVESEVVFGGLGSGVANRKRNDGLPSYNVPVQGITSPGADGPTFLDLVWDGAPFQTHEDFLRAVRTVADGFVSAGVYSVEERDKIIETARKAEAELEPVKKKGGRSRDL